MVQRLSPTTRPERRSSRAIAQLILLVAIGAAIGIATFGMEISHKRAEQHHRSGETVKGLASIVAEQTARTIQTVDLTLLGAIDALTYDRADGYVDQATMQHYLHNKQQSSALLRNLFILDETGVIVNEAESVLPSRLNLSDRPYFTLQRHNPDFGLYISAPMISRVTHDWAIAMSRRIEGLDGEFAGAVVASMDLSRLNDNFARSTLVEGAEIALFLENGSLLSRSPHVLSAYSSAFLSNSWMARADSGKPLFTTESPVDGVRRLYALYRVPGQPVYVLAGIDESAMQQAMQREWIVLGILSGLIAAAIGLLGFLALRNNRRRERLLAALGDSELVFRDFAEAASDRFWETDAEHRLTWHSGLHMGPNGALPDYIGKTRWGNLGIDPDQDPLWGTLKADMDAHRTFREFRYTRPKAGSGIHHRIVSGKPVFDHDGTFLGYRGIYSDVTAQVTTQERAQKSRDRFLRSIESLTEGFALYDADDRLVVCNTRFQELYAPVANSLVRWSSFEDFLREAVKLGLIPEARGREEEWVATRMEQHQARSYRFEAERKGRWVEIRERADKEGGTMILVLDIHEQKMAELRRQALAQRLKLMIDNMPVGCFLLDKDRRILDWNPAAERIFGYSKTEAIGFDPLDLIVPPEQRPAIEAKVVRLYGGDEIVTNVSSNRTKDGRTIACEWTNARLTDDRGESVGLVCMMRDVSERHAAEEKMRQTTRMEAIGQLTGGIAHDFNNLLQIIIGNTEILCEYLEDQPRLQRWATLSKQAAEHGADLTLRLLAYSRRQTLEPVDADLNEILHEIEPLIARSLGESVAVTSSPSDDLWTATLDRGQIDQALLNITLNARDAMPNGGSLHIATSNASLGLADTAGEVKPGDFVCITISDTGAGMPPDVLKRAFEPFFSTKGVGKGNGLGLSMVHGFVNQSGGLVRLDSEVGKGTIVRIYFPRSTTSRTPDKRPSEAANIDLGRKTILVVEDNDMVRNYVTAQLDSLGYNVLEAENGPAALIKMQEVGEIDLLFTDVIMPGGMNGRELAERAVVQRPDMKVLFTSGYDESAITTDGYLTEGLYLLKKPYQRKELETKIIEVLTAEKANVAA